MKIVEQDLKKQEIKLQLENIDDLWHLYNLIMPSDHLYGKTERRIRRDNEGSRADSGERVQVFLGIEVEKFEFHPFTTRLRVTGRIIFGPEDLVSLHDHHTFNILPNSEITLVKKKWTPYFLKRLERALESSKTPEFLMIAIEKGEATIATVSDIGINFVARITGNIPGKRYGVTYHDKALQDFFENVLQVIAEHVGSQRAKIIIVGGPGSVKEHFHAYLRKKSPNLARLVKLEDASSGTKSAIFEMIKRGKISREIENFRIMEEEKLMEEVLKRIGMGKGEVAYGLSEVERAISYGAIETLLLTDTRFREGTEEERRKIEDMIIKTEQAGGKPVFISIHHPAGEQLEKLGGIAALLRFAI
ncbi:MAG: mRNA surveillance protein pelota [Candidatus Helarchaeales archaeon]